MSLIQLLQEMAREVEAEVDELNFGGCGVYAAAVARRLQLLSIPTECLVECGYPSSKDVGKAYRKHRPRNVREFGLSFHHVYVRFAYEDKQWVHESRATKLWDEFKRDRWIYLHKGSLTPQEMAKLARSPLGWNRCFQRRRYLPRVRQIVNSHFDRAFPIAPKRISNKNCLNDLQLSFGFGLLASPNY